MVWCKWCLFPRDMEQGGCLCDSNPDPEAKFEAFDALEAIDTMKVWLGHMERAINDERSIEKASGHLNQIEPVVTAMRGTFNEVLHPGNYEKRMARLMERYGKD